MTNFPALKAQKYSPLPRKRIPRYTPAFPYRRHRHRSTFKLLPVRFFQRRYPFQGWSSPFR